MTPDEMREKAEKLTVYPNIKAWWMIAAELCERMDKVAYQLMRISATEDGYRWQHISANRSTLVCNRCLQGWSEGHVCKLDNNPTKEPPK